jgi:hypothetical protein
VLCAYGRAQVRMGLDSGSKVWNPGTWIQGVLHHRGLHHIESVAT